MIVYLVCVFDIQINIVEERLPSDVGTQDKPSIPGLYGAMADEDKKKRRKNKGNKNSEAADEAGMKETNLAAPQTQGRLISLMSHWMRLQVGI